MQNSDMIRPLFALHARKSNVSAFEMEGLSTEGNVISQVKLSFQCTHLILHIRYTSKTSGGATSGIHSPMVKSTILTDRSSSNLKNSVSSHPIQHLPISIPITASTAICARETETATSLLVATSMKIASTETLTCTIVMLLIAIHQMTMKHVSSF